MLRYNCFCIILLFFFCLFVLSLGVVWDVHVHFAWNHHSVLEIKEESLIYSSRSSVSNIFDIRRLHKQYRVTHLLNFFLYAFSSSSSVEMKLLVFFNFAQFEVASFHL